ncbi:MAG: L,D-transpeptidase family protein [Candidatus Eisenbacteria bacterium]
MSRRLLVVVVLALAAVFGFLYWQNYLGGVNRTTVQVSREIKSALKRRDMPDDAPWRDRRTQSLLRAFYAGRRMRPAWTTGAGPTEQARELSKALLNADAEGLNSEDYSAAELAGHLERNEGTPLVTGDPKALAEFDMLCTIAAFHYMSDVFDGRIAPKALDAAWVANPRKGDLDAMLDGALKESHVQELLQGLAPSHEGYRKLRDARAGYAKIVGAGGWNSIPAGGPLKRGSRGPRVAALRARLAMSGDLDSTASRGQVFDEALAAAVARYQTRYGRDADGVVGEPERAELNVSAEARLRQIELNMERWRWLPKTLGDRYLVVNIPEYKFHVIERGNPVLEMRVVVGKALNATPVFSDQMTQVVVNPTWNVPASIAGGEIVPELQQDRDYLAKNSMRVFSGTGDDAQELDAASVNWSDESETAKLNFRQDAGDQNALGRIKFLFPNQFDVYLHDTPAGHLFSREERSFSHGCVRVEEPLKLAEYVLRGLPEADPDRINELIAAGETKTIQIPQPLPVHIVYFTAFVEENGTVGFREDVYGIDQDLMAQLRGRARAQARQ